MQKKPKIEQKTLRLLIEDKILFSVLIIILTVFIFVFQDENRVGAFNNKIFGLTFIIGLGTILALSNIPKNNITLIFGILRAIIEYSFGLNPEKRND